jgi:ribosome maturation factor RimP
MNKKQIVQEVESYLEPIAQKFSLEIVDVEFVKEGPTYYLRIYIDKEGGVNIADCQTTSRAIEVILDEKDPIEMPYTLEVSSPGLDRLIKKEKDFVRFRGHVVDVKLYEAIQQKKRLQGELIFKDDTILTLKLENEEILEIPMKNIVQVRLAILF